MIQRPSCSALWILTKSLNSRDIKSRALFSESLGCFRLPEVARARLAALIIAFDGTKRVHALGKFYGKCPKKEAANCPCPTCKRMGLQKIGVLSFDAKVLPNGGSIPRLSLVSDLEAQGYLPLHGDGRTTDFGDVRAADGASP